MAVGKRKCKSCKKYVREFILTPKGVFCNYDSAAKWGYDNKDKGKQIKHKADKKRLKDNDKPLRNREAQKAFNAYIRARDSLLPCVSCGRFHTGKYDAGHYRSRGAFPELRFNELNCHKQCSPCNTQLSGNIANYRPILLERIGQEMLDFVEGPHEPVKYTCAELKEIELLYKRKLKELNNDS